MSTKSIKLRLRWILGLALLAVTTGTLAPSPRVEAADCGGWAGGMTGEWQVTAAAQARNSLGECGPNATCMQWCTISCGETTPENQFDCFPN